MSNKSVPTDDDLIHLLKKGDMAAFAEIYSRYAAILAGFATSKLSNIEDAKDLLHDLFVSLWEKRSTLVITTDLRSYLFASTRYKVVDNIRKNITREDYKLLLQTLPEPEADSIEKVGEAKEMKALIDRSLEKLPVKTKEIYKLSREQYRSIPEIAKLLGISEQTVKNQLTMALKHLRQTISNFSLLAIVIDLLKK